MRFHLLTLVHLPQSREYMSCAFTQKNRKLAKMLTDLGHEVFFYASEGSDIEEYCNSSNLHYIETHTLEDIRSDYGEGNNDFEIGYDWKNKDFKHDFNKPRCSSTKLYYANCIELINKEKRADDFLLLMQGKYFNPIADEVKLFLTCEPGIGYRGSDLKHFRAFESSYLQNFTYGSEHPYECVNGQYYDRVIPNYFDDNDFNFSNYPSDYYLYMGRMIRRKGIMIADLVSRQLNKQLIIAGQGAHVTRDGKLVPNHEPDFELPPGTWTYLGYQDPLQRKELMSHALFTFVPTIYLEAFGGVHVKSMLSGTPVLTTNFGVFTETFTDGIGGFHCNTLDDFCYYAGSINMLDRELVRSHAERYLMANVMWQYQCWFDDLYAVFESTQDNSVKGWHRIRKDLPRWRMKQDKHPAVSSCICIDSTIM